MFDMFSKSLLISESSLSQKQPSSGVLANLQENKHAESSNIQGYLAHFPAPDSKFFPKKISYIFSKKVFFIFREMELSNPKIRKNLKLYGPSPQNFSLKNFLYFFLKKTALKKFLIFSQKNLF